MSGKRLKNIAQDYNEPLEVLIPRMITEEGSIHKAAIRLGVYPNAIQYWMKKNGYRLVTQQVATLEKEEPTPEVA